jgi:hypothetical protein
MVSYNHASVTRSAFPLAIVVPECLMLFTDSFQKRGLKRERIIGMKFIYASCSSLFVLFTRHFDFLSAVCPPVWDFFHSSYGGGPVIARGDANIFDAVFCDFLRRFVSHCLVT